MIAEMGIDYCQGYYLGKPVELVTETPDLISFAKD